MSITGDASATRIAVKRYAGVATGSEGAMNTHAFVAGDIVHIIDPTRWPGHIYYFGEQYGIVLRKTHALPPACTLYAVAPLDKQETRRGWSLYPGRLLELM